MGEGHSLGKDKTHGLDTVFLGALEPEGETSRSVPWVKSGPTPPALSIHRTSTFVYSRESHLAYDST